jgi:hypothetical protein
VFGTLGLLGFGADCEETFPVNYNVSAGEVFQCITYWCIQQEEPLDILALGGTNIFS